MSKDPEVIKTVRGWTDRNAESFPYLSIAYKQPDQLIREFLCGGEYEPDILSALDLFPHLQPSVDDNAIFLEEMSAALVPFHYLNRPPCRGTIGEARGMMPIKPMIGWDVIIGDDEQEAAVYGSLTDACVFLKHLELDWELRGTLEYHAESTQCPDCHGCGTDIFDDTKRCKKCNGLKYQSRPLILLLMFKSITSGTPLTFEEALEAYNSEVLKPETKPIRVEVK
jgi:hypothetical protein